MTMGTRTFYKFFSVEGAKKTLSGNSLKYSPPNSFNDPFEFMPRGYGSISPEEKKGRIQKILLQDVSYKKMYEEAYNGRIVLTNKGWAELVESFPPPMQEMGERIFKALSNRKWTDLVDMVSTQVAFTSFSEYNDNILMWAHYSENHKGIALGFNMSDEDRMHKVTYSRERPLLPISTSVDDEDYRKGVAALMATKSDLWAYECEWRRIISLSELNKKEDIYLLSLEPEVVSSIIFGYKTEEALKESVRAAVTKYPNCKLYEAKIDQREYKINIVPC
jgi:hypothetical protein